MERKLELGHADLEARLARELRLSARSSRLLAALSRGRRRICTVELTGPEGAAEAMPGFYRQAMEAGDETPLLIASPGAAATDRHPGRRPDGVGGPVAGGLRHQFSNWIEATTESVRPTSH